MSGVGNAAVPSVDGEVGDVIAGQRNPDQVLEPAGEQGQRVRVVGQVVVVDRQYRAGRIPAKRRGRVVDVAIVAQELEARRRRERRVHRLAERDDLGHVGRGRREDLAVDRRADDVRGHVGREERVAVRREGLRRSRP